MDLKDSEFYHLEAPMISRPYLQVVRGFLTLKKRKSGQNFEIILSESEITDSCIFQNRYLEGQDWPIPAQNTVICGLSPGDVSWDLFRIRIAGMKLLSFAPITTTKFLLLLLLSESLSGLQKDSTWYCD